METIIQKICLFVINLIPNKKARHNLRDAINKYFNLSIISMSAIEKRASFLKGEYTTVSIGSSHGDCSFDPDYIEGSAYNLCLSSSDAFMTYEIYRNFIKNSQTKNVIVFYDVFTKGSNNSKAKGFKYHFFPLKYIFLIDYQGDDKKVEKKCKKEIEKFKIKDVSYKGFYDYKFPVVNEEEVEFHYNSHLKLWKRGGENEWIVKIAQECIEDNKKFILVISPVTQRYKNFMPDSKILFEDILNELKNLSGFSKSGIIYNFYDSNEFDDETIWIDPDHFNKKGSEIFSKTLNDKLKKDGII